MALPNRLDAVVSEEELLRLFEGARDIGLRLELIRESIIFEAMPGAAHQRAVFAVQASLQGLEPAQLSRGPCACAHLADVGIVLSPKVVKRPDIAIWCEAPLEQEGLIHTIPEAVIEITSPGYEDKDLVQGPPLYLAAGVKDVLVLDRRDATVHRWTAAGHETVPSPQEFILACGCSVTV